MNSKIGIVFNIAAIAAAIIMFTSAPLVADQQVLAFDGGGMMGAL
jgi:hypothetical protein